MVRVSSFDSGSFDPMMPLVGVASRLLLQTCGSSGDLSCADCSLLVGRLEVPPTAAAGAGVQSCADCWPLVGKLEVPPTAAAGAGALIISKLETWKVMSSVSRAFGVTSATTIQLVPTVLLMAGGK